MLVSYSGSSFETATPDDIKAVFDAIDTTLRRDDAMPGESQTFFPQDRVELIPVENLDKLTVQRRGDVPGYATVRRKAPAPEISPDAVRSEVFRLRIGDTGVPRISQDTEIINPERLQSSLDDLLEAWELEKLTGLDSVSRLVCQGLVRQISATRVHPIQPTHNNEHR